jgi:hypothetical protein
MAPRTEGKAKSVRRTAVLPEAADNEAEPPGHALKGVPRIAVMVQLSFCQGRQSRNGGSEDQR